jgi:hypothetical protein
MGANMMDPSRRLPVLRTALRTTAHALAQIAHGPVRVPA